MARVKRRIDRLGKARKIAGTVRSQRAFPRESARRPIMASNQRPNLGFAALLGGVVVLALVIFIVTGGQLGGSKKVASDADLPQVTSPKPPPGGPTRDAGNVGTR
jgi:hypothetical protein